MFLVWTERTAWRDVAFPPTVNGHRDLQEFVRSRAAASGIDVAKPFPFVVGGTAAEIRWPVNVDRTEGQPITPGLFAKSKASYVLTNEALDIVGFYSEGHAVLSSAGSGRSSATSGMTLIRGRRGTDPRGRATLSEGDLSPEA